MEKLCSVKVLVNKQTRGLDRRQNQTISKVVNNGFQNEELIESFSTVFVSSKKDSVCERYCNLKFR